MLGRPARPELELPVFLYGELAGGRTRAELRARRRRRARSADRRRRAAARLRPAGSIPTAGAVLVAARPPLVAFNLELAPPATSRTPSGSPPRIREGGAEGLPGCGRSGCGSSTAGVAQVSTNVEDHRGHAAAPRRRGRRPRTRRSPGRARRARARRPRSTSFPHGRRRSADQRPIEQPVIDGPHYRVSSSTMAQTKRKRRTKHRGNAAGMSRRAAAPGASRRRRSARSSTRDQRAAGARRPSRRRGTARLDAGGAGRGVMFFFLLGHQKSRGRAGAGVRRVRDGALHPARLLHATVASTAPAQAAESSGRSELIDVRMFTVGPVQENCFIVAPRRRRPRR